MNARYQMPEKFDKNRAFSLGVDVGGTFTDFALVNESTNSFSVHKQLTTTSDPSVAFFQGVETLCERFKIAPNDFNRIIHGTTLVANTIVERKGAKTGLICTKGFRDILDMRKENRYDVYDLNITYAPPFIPRYLRREVNERTKWNGEILKDIELPDVERAITSLVEEGIESVAVCLIHSYANPTNEKKIADLIRRKFPMLYVTISSEVSPMLREYERTSTVALNAYTQPTISHYLRQIKQRLDSAGFAGNFYVMSTTGGAMDPVTAMKFPIKLLESGPAAGALMAKYVGDATRRGNIFSFDMGGTTSKGCVIRNHEISKTYEIEIARVQLYKAGSGLKVLVPSVWLLETGGGGGSIANIDSRGVIKVGPESVGANPGPACYSLGGIHATATDADLLLGYLNPSYFLGGRMKLDSEAAKNAIESNVASKLSVTPQDAAWTIHETLNEDIARAFRMHCAERGIDRRDFCLMAFGGAGPLHASRILRKLGMKSVVIPPAAGVFSSFGLLSSPLTFDYSKTIRLSLTDISEQEYAKHFAELIERGSSLLRSAGVDNSHIDAIRAIDMRYEGQGYDVEVPLGKGNPDRDELGRLRSLFEEQYEKIFRIKKLSDSIETTTFKVSVIESKKAYTLNTEDYQANGPESKDRKRDIYIEGQVVESPVYNRYSLKRGARFYGPALIEEREATTLIEPGVEAHIDDLGNIIMEM